MPHFKDENNKLFWLNPTDDPSVWLPNCVEISDAEAETLRQNILSAIEDSRTYAEKRRAEYPQITDYIDGVVKGDQQQIEKYIADCLAVKAKYPKP
jgi:hypothetical protein